MEGLEVLGLKLDPEKNNVRGKETIISTDDSPNKILLIPTNEELVIALDTACLVQRGAASPMPARWLSCA